MKTLNILFLGVVVLFMMSCNMGAKKDLVTGLQVKNKELTFEKADLSVDGQKTTANEFPLNTKIMYTVNGIKGFVEKDSMVYIGASLTVYDEDNKEVLNYPDLFAEYDSTGVSPVDASVVTLFLTIGSPMVEGKDYIWKTRIWDKNGKGEITSEVGVTVKK